MKNTSIIVVIICFLLILVGGYLFLRRASFQGGGGVDTTGSSTIQIPDSETALRITNPMPNQLIKSPLTIEGEARGSWYFEASFPVRLLDAAGNQLAIIPAQAQGDWMTESFVPFKTVMTFATPTSETGTLVFEKDNPSGLPEYAGEYRLPVRFESASSAPATTSQRNVKLYYYDSRKDIDSSGNTVCSAKGLVTVERTVPRTLSPISDTLQLLLKGELTAEERTKGLTTEFPLPGLELKLASVSSSILTLTFQDPQQKTSGGACRSQVLWAQIEATAKQFEGIKNVVFKPEILFQP